MKKIRKCRIVTHAINFEQIVVILNSRLETREINSASFVLLFLVEI